MVVGSIATSATASTRYYYEGNPFTDILDNSVVPGGYSSGDALSGWFDLASPLTLQPFTDISSLVLDFEFSDGNNTISAVDATVSNFQVGVDATGDLTEWAIIIGEGATPVSAGELGDDAAAFFTVSASSLAFDSGNYTICLASPCSTNLNTRFDQARVDDNPGTWRSVPMNPVPLPASAWLLIGGLAAGFSVTRRVKRG